MDTNANLKPSKAIQYTPDTFDDFLAELPEKDSSQTNRLCLFIGRDKQQKELLLKKVANQTQQTIKEIDLGKVITINEQDSYANIDRLWEKVSTSETILYFKNYLSLNGVYTGNTQSKVKYATPQERHFLKKVQKSTCLVIIDVSNVSDAGVTLQRAASWIVNFETELSFFKKIVAQLKDVSVQGNQFESKRPLQYR